MMRPGRARALSLLGLLVATSGLADDEAWLRAVDGTGIDFVNVSGSHEAKRTIVEENGSGAALFDYDGDGDLDLYLVNGATLGMLAGDEPPVRNALYRNDGDWRFVDVTAAAGVGDPGWGFGAAVGDVDGDGDPDLYVTNFGANVLYANQGDGRFEDITTTAGVGDEGWGHSAAFGDVDGDGDLDLYVTNNLEFRRDRLPNNGRPCPYRGLEVACGPIGFPPQADRLYRNEGAGRFTDISEASGIHAPDPQFGLGVKMVDVDDDGRTDIYVANDSGPNFLFHNQGVAETGPETGTVRFDEIAFLSGVATPSDGRFQAGMGVDAGDADGDGRPELFVTNFSYDHNTFYRNGGDGLFSDQSHPSGLGGPSRMSMAWGTRFVDLDHDGDLDLYVANGHLYPEVDAGGIETFAQANQLFANRGDGRFDEVSHRIARGGVRVSRGVAVGDLDGDGDPDLVVAEMGAGPTLLRNDGARGNAFVLDLRAGGANPRAAGATVQVVTGDRAQYREVSRSGSYLSSSEPAVHVGVGAALRIDAIEIRWPGGGRTALRGLEANRRYVVRRR